MKHPRDTQLKRAILHFLSYVNVCGEDECWEWLGSISKNGYGIYFSSVHGDGRMTAHRRSFYLFNGPFPLNAQIRHRCDNPSCVNPNHLQVGTHKHNMEDMSKRGRHHRQRLTKKDILNIYNDPRKQIEIAEDYAIVQSHISAIKSGKKYGLITRKAKKKVRKKFRVKKRKTT